MTTTLTHLAKVRAHLRFSHAEATIAAEQLEGARHARAAELVELIEDAIAFAERLAFVVEGDLRADQAESIRWEAQP